MNPSAAQTNLPIPWVIAGVSGLVCAGLISVSIGAAGLSIGGIVTDIASRLPLVGVDSTLSETDASILWQVRMPRIVLGALVGGMLAIAGAAYQGTFRNPLADPYLLGVAAGAGLGATIAIIYGGQQGNVSFVLVGLCAFIGALVAATASYLFGTLGGASTTSLILAGVAVAAFLSSAQTYVQLSNTESLREVFSWMVGRMSAAGWTEIRPVLPVVVVTTVLLIACRKVLDVLAVGDEEATALGVRVTAVRLTVLVAASLGTAAVVAVSGLIGFVGIVVPHALRLVIGTSYARLIPLSFLSGATFLILADLLGRTVISPGELPIGVVTSFIGAPFFLFILFRTEGAGS